MSADRRAARHLVVALLPALLQAQVGRAQTQQDVEIAQSLFEQGKVHDAIEMLQVAARSPSLDVAAEAKKRLASIEEKGTALARDAKSILEKDPATAVWSYKQISSDYAGLPCGLAAAQELARLLAPCKGLKWKGPAVPAGLEGLALTGGQGGAIALYDRCILPSGDTTEGWTYSFLDGQGNKLPLTNYLVPEDFRLDLLAPNKKGDQRIAARNDKLPKNGRIKGITIGPEGRFTFDLSQPGDTASPWEGTILAAMTDGSQLTLTLGRGLPIEPTGTISIQGESLEIEPVKASAKPATLPAVQRILDAASASLARVVALAVPRNRK